MYTDSESKWLIFPFLFPNQHKSTSICSYKLHSHTDHSWKILIAYTVTNAFMMCIYVWFADLREQQDITHPPPPLLSSTLKWPDSGGSLHCRMNACRSDTGSPSSCWCWDTDTHNHSILTHTSLIILLFTIAHGILNCMHCKKYLLCIFDIQIFKHPCIRCKCNMSWKQLTHLAGLC